jgi:DNA-binding beta-propeller fold protein YncE
MRFFDVENIPLENCCAFTSQKFPPNLIAFDETGQRVFVAHGNSVSIIDLANSNNVTKVTTNSFQWT